MNGRATIAGGGIWFLKVYTPLLPLTVDAGENPELLRGTIVRISTAGDRLPLILLVNDAFGFLVVKFLIDSTIFTFTVDALRLRFYIRAASAWIGLIAENK